MKEKGFTLIELLAIIVILAIIAVITVPIVLNIIDNAKIGTVRASAYGYKDAINKFYLSKLGDDSNFEIESKKYTFQQLKNMGVNTSGQEPESNSWLKIQDNKVIQGCLQFDEYKVEIIDGEIGTPEKGNCELSAFEGKFVAPATGDTHLGIVYLDPTNLSNECDETNSNSALGTKEGCMKFYIFKEYTKNNNTYIDLILDHNTTSYVIWSDYQSGTQYTNSKGPMQALYQLYLDTSNWTGIPDLVSDDNYSVSWTWTFNSNSASYTIDYTKHLVSNTSYNYSDDSVALKARFITAEEVASITGMNTEQNPNNWTLASQNFYFGSASTTSYSSQTPEQQAKQRSYCWLVDGFSSSGACPNDITTSTGNGYWTASPTATTYDSALYVHRLGYIGLKTIHNGLGIRPVISLPKSLIISQ